MDSQPIVNQPNFKGLFSLIDAAMQADRFPLRRRLQTMEQAARKGQAIDRNLERWKQDVQRSTDLLEQRRAKLPKPTFDDELPISLRRQEIADALSQHQVIVVCGETGSGKSTQLPKICLELGRGVSGLIGHTQPRRIAARSIAARLAEELGRPLGQDVGFKIRFTDTTSPLCHIKLMTDGILLAESQGDRFLSQYDTLIIDEAHERSLNIDFLLGYIHRLLPRRRDLKVIITSATIDAQRFASYFEPVAGKVPVLEIEGRTYPVELLYRPQESDEEGEEPDWEQCVAQAIEELARIDRGHILLFVPTERDIRAAAKTLRGRSWPGDVGGKQTEILPLYGRLSTQEQNRVFKPYPHRRIVIATNVAESSLTVPGIRYVVDTGTARISRYSARSKVQRLPIEPISQASADQRKGRCGRVGPGVCVRLYSEQDYQTRDRFTPPEIQRTNLASVILQTKALNLGPLEEFPFLDPPKPAAVTDGYKTLFELSALDDQRNLTELGRRISRLPVDPRIARIILAGHDENCLHEILIIASALELQDPRDRPAEKQAAADEAHAQFAHPDSDFLSYLKLWDFFRKVEHDLSHSKLRRACQQNFLSFNRMCEWIDVHQQLVQLTDEAGLKQHARRDDYGAIHRALLTGLLSNIALRGENNEYTGAGGQKFFLWPGSGLFAQKPKWVVAAELVETSRRYLRTAGKIDADWIEPLAQHLVNRSYSNPRWEAKSGNILADEKVSLFGLVIVPQRRVNYGPIDPVVSRDLFIRHALLAAELTPPPEFLTHNQQLITDCENLQAKARRANLMLGEQAQFDFYAEHVPADVFDAARFRRWWLKEQQTHPRLLFMKPSDVMLDESDLLRPGDFPDALDLGRMKLPLEYHLEPGAEEDGITLTVPQAGLNQLLPARLGWLVPGLLEEKLVALIKTLPKPLRRLFVPVPDTAKKVLAELQFGEGHFTATVARILTKMGGQAVPVEAFQEDKLPKHLQMQVRVVDDQGKSLAVGRNMAELRNQLGEGGTSFQAMADERWHRDALSAWDFGELTEQVTVSRGGVTLLGYPALIADADRETVSLRLLDSAPQAALQTRAAIRRWWMVGVKRDLKQQVEHIPHLNQLTLNAASFGGAAEFRRQLTELIAERSLFADQPLPRTREAFEKLSKMGRIRMTVAVQEVTQLIGPLMKNLHQVKLHLDRQKNSPLKYAITDLRDQLAQLTPPGFLILTPWEWLRHYPRYLQAMLHRLEKLTPAVQSADRKAFDLISPRWQRYVDRWKLHQQRGLLDPALVQYRWMMEEYRVSLFAQKLGTSLTVSDKRMDKQWAEVQP